MDIRETAYDEEPNSYFQLLTLLTDHLEEQKSSTSQQTLDAATKLIKEHELFVAASLSTFNYALGLHTAAPRLEAFYKWYEDTIDEESLVVGTCGSWVDWRGKGYCDASTLKLDMETTTEAVADHDEFTPLPFDHQLPVPLESTISTAILYFDLESPSTSSLLRLLQSHAKSNPSFQLVVRYKPLRGRGVDPKRTLMSGYGVEMALKKMDYLVVDDRNQISGRSSSSSSEGSLGGQSRDIFAQALGNDPWAENSTPLSSEEIAGMLSGPIE